MWLFRNLNVTGTIEAVGNSKSARDSYGGPQAQPMRLSVRADSACVTSLRGDLQCHVIIP